MRREFGLRRLTAFRLTFPDCAPRGSGPSGEAAVRGDVLDSGRAGDAALTNQLTRWTPSSAFRLLTARLRSAHPVASLMDCPGHARNVRVRIATRIGRIDTVRTVAQPRRPAAIIRFDDILSGALRARSGNGRDVPAASPHPPAVARGSESHSGPVAAVPQASGSAVRAVPGPPPTRAGGRGCRAFAARLRRPRRQGCSRAWRRR